MKCKSCGSELIAGTKKCPYCGAVINIVRTRAEDVFDWSAVSPQSKEKKDVSIDWNTGKIFDKRSGQVYNQNNHTWSEPEDVKDLFKFDRKNEEYQHVLDRQVESASEAASAPAAEAQACADDVKRKFDLPSSMGMRKFDPSAIKNADIRFVSESGEEVGSIGKPKVEAEASKNAVADMPVPAPKPEAKKPEPKAEFKFEDHDPGKNISTDTGFKFNKPDLRSEKKEPPSPAEQPAKPAAAESKAEQPAAAEKNSSKDTYTPEEEDRVYKSLKKLMAAEEKFKSDMERASYITPEEAVQAAKVEEKCSKLTFVPTVSFRTIEDEYAAYCDEHGIKREKPKAAPPASDAAKTEPAEKEHEAKHKKHSLRESIKESLRSLERDPEKAVEIKINEPSGTKVTVKTQEVSLAAAERELENAPTREVNMEEVVKPPKNLQVSVEVNAAQGNASVEVTRRHDGATVVKTVDKGHNEHLYVDDQEKTKTISDESIDDENDGSESGASFWERPDGIKKMTITDIFGPEARKILNQIDKNNSKEAKKDDEDLENSLILDIDPEDIAMTEDQTAALHTIAAEIIEDEPYDEEDIEEAEVESVETTEDETEAAETATEAASDEAEGNDAAEETAEEAAAGGRADESDGTADISAEPAEVEVTAEKAEENEQENGAEQAAVSIAPESAPLSYSAEPKEQPEQAVIEVNTEKDDDKKPVPADDEAQPAKNEHKKNGRVNIWASAPADKKSAPEPVQRDESAVSGIDKIPELEKTRPIMKAEKAIMKEAARQKKRAEKAQKKLLKENKVKKNDDKKPAKSSENRGLSKVLKLFTAILVIILIIEFSIIGIKLFASDSQAAVFIDKVEQYAVDIVRGGNDTGSADQQTQQDAAAPDAQPDQTAGDGSGEAPAEGA